MFSVLQNMIMKYEALTGEYRHLSLAHQQDRSKRQDPIRHRNDVLSMGGHSSQYAFSTPEYTHLVRPRPQLENILPVSE
jgi:DUF1680 family protein